MIEVNTNEVNITTFIQFLKHRFMRGVTFKYFVSEDHIILNRCYKMIISVKCLKPHLNIFHVLLISPPEFSEPINHYLVVY